MSYRLSEETYFRLVSLALVADFGPFEPSRHTKKYFDAHAYFPRWVS